MFFLHLAFAYSERGWVWTSQPLTSLGWFFHRDGMYARKWPLPGLCTMWILPPYLKNIDWLFLYISLWCKTQLFFFCSAMWIYFKYQLAYLPQLHTATFPCSPLCPFLCGPPSVHTCERARRAKNPPDVLAVEIGKSRIIRIAVAQSLLTSSNFKIYICKIYMRAFGL